MVASEAPHMLNRPRAMGRASQLESSIDHLSQSESSIDHRSQSESSILVLSANKNAPRRVTAWLTHLDLGHGRALRDKALDIRSNGGPENELLRMVMRMCVCMRMCGCMCVCTGISLSK